MKTYETKGIVGKSQYLILYFIFQIIFVILIIGCATSKSEHLKEKRFDNKQHVKAVGKKIIMLRKVPFNEHANISDAVRTECNLQTKLSHFIKTYAKEYSMDIDLVDELPKDKNVKVLLIQITDTKGRSGGGWSGPKTVSITGGIRENGKLIGSFDKKRTTTGGPFGGFKSTCAFFGRCVKVLGKDVVIWMRNLNIKQKLLSD